jgi:hypothetical protein
MTNLIRKGWMDDHLTLTWLDLVNFTGGAAIYMRPTLTYIPPSYEDLQFDVGFNIFAGERFSLVGQYHDHSSLIASARIYF